MSNISFDSEPFTLRPSEDYGLTIETGKDPWKMCVGSSWEVNGERVWTVTISSKARPNWWHRFWQRVLCGFRWEPNDG